MAFRVGIDIGGTFTDLVLIDEAGRVAVDKVPSTPPRFAQGVIDGLAKLQVPITELEFFSHGTTAATNAIIEKKGARTGLITTHGFRDVLEIRRADRGSLYDYWWRPPPPLVPRQLRREVRERIAYDGSEVEPLREEDVLKAIEFLRGYDVEAIAICFLNSFTNPAHERRAKELIEEHWPEVFVCTSVDVLPELLEFERTSTTVANAYVGPVMSRYLADLAGRMREGGYRDDIFIMGSSGGMMTTQQAEQLPVATAVSGLAAGVMAGAKIAQEAGLRNLITLDVGGRVATSPSSTSTPRALRPSGSSSLASRSSYRRSIFILWAPAAARSPGSTRAAGCRSDRRVLAQSPGRSATATAAQSRRRRTPSSSWGGSTPTSGATAMAGISTVTPPSAQCGNGSPTRSG
jgi:N-methylhydantoinase A